MASLVRSLSKVALLTGLQLNSDNSLPTPPPPHKKKNLRKKSTGTWIEGHSKTFHHCKISNNYVDSEKNDILEY